jgi:hypothetical protein
MRAYSHQGHGPRADQTGRIHISDFRYLRTISLAKCSRSIHLGQKQNWLSSNGMSALPSTADMRRIHRHVGFVPRAIFQHDQFATVRQQIGCSNSLLQPYFMHARPR